MPLRSRSAGFNDDRTRYKKEREKMQARFKEAMRDCAKREVVDAMSDAKQAMAAARDVRASLVRRGCDIDSSITSSVGGERMQ